MDVARPAIGFIGAGRVATALALALDHADYQVIAVASRTFAAAAALASKLSGCTAFEDAQAVVDGADLVFVTTPDAAIRSVVESLHWRAAVAAVHTSGVVTRDVLETAAAAGAETASLHPLQTFAAIDTHTSLAGIAFGLEADGRLREALLRLVRDLGATAIELRAEDKALYHAAAVFASNYVVTLMKLASDLWLRLGAERPVAVRALLPLLRGAIDNLDRVGLPGSLTGPIDRGDVEALALHLEALTAASPELLPLYRELALQTLPIALAKGRLGEEPAQALRSLLTGATASPLEGTRRL